MRIRFSGSGHDTHDDRMALLSAAHRAGVVLDIRDSHGLPRLKAWEYRVGLRPAPDGKYCRVSASWSAVNKDGSPRRVHAVCWHGHRAFFRALYAALPAGVTCRIITTMATYRDAEDFERTHDATGDRNIGSLMRPVGARDACQCGEEA